jgi:hypothetical protein
MPLLPVNHGSHDGWVKFDFGIAKFLASDVRFWAQKRIASSKSYYDAGSGMQSKFS